MAINDSPISDRPPRVRDNPPPRDSRSPNDSPRDRPPREPIRDTLPNRDRLPNRDEPPRQPKKKFNPILPGNSPPQDDLEHKFGPVWGTPNRPIEPWECDKWPNSPYCGENPIDTTPIDFEINIVNNECWTGIEICPTLGFVKFACVQYLYKKNNPDCDRPPDLPEKEWYKEYPLGPGLTFSCQTGLAIAVVEKVVKFTKSSDVYRLELTKENAWSVKEILWTNTTNELSGKGGEYIFKTIRRPSLVPQSELTGGDYYYDGRFGNMWSRGAWFDVIYEYKDYEDPNLSQSMVQPFPYVGNYGNNSIGWHYDPESKTYGAKGLPFGIYVGSGANLENLLSTFEPTQKEFSKGIADQYFTLFRNQFIEVETGEVLWEGYVGEPLGVSLKGKDYFPYYWEVGLAIEKNLSHKESTFYKLLWTDCIVAPVLPPLTDPIDRWKNKDKDKNDKECDCMSCCDDSLTKLILKMVTELKTDVAKLKEDVNKATEEINKAKKIIGDFPVEIEITDDDPKKQGEQKRKVKIESISQYIKENFEFLNDMDVVLGISRFPAKLPSRLIKPNGKGEETIKDLPEFLGYIIKQIDKSIGLLPQKIKIADGDLAKEGNQAMEVEVHSLADFARETLKILLDTSGESDVHTNMLIRALYELGFIHQGLIQNNASTDAILEHLDFKHKWVAKEYPFAFNPYCQNNSMARGFGKDKNSKESKEPAKLPDIGNNEKELEKMLPKLLEETWIKIRTIENVEQRSLNQDIKAILRNAEIASRANSVPATEKKLDELVEAEYLKIQIREMINDNTNRRSITGGNLPTTKPQE